MMPTQVHGPIPATCLKDNRGNFLGKPTDLIGTPTHSPTTSSMGFSINTTRPLTVRRGKKRPFQQKKRGNETMVLSRQGAGSGFTSAGIKTKNVDLPEAESQRECGLPAFVSSSAGTLLNQGSGAGLGRSNAGKEEQSPGLGSDQLYHQKAYNQNTAQILGLLDRNESVSGGQAELVRPSAISSRQSELSTTSMELPFRLSLKDRRPKIQLTIPQTQSKPCVAISQDPAKDDRVGNPQDTPKMVSPLSSTTRPRMYSAGPPARLSSVVSPLSVMEMPKPRRPFSTFSLEDMTLALPDSTPLMSKSASSDSSDDTGDHDDRSSNYSPRSSMSSLMSDSGLIRPIEEKRPDLAFSIMSPTAAGVFESTLPAPQIPKPLRTMRSVVSLTEKVNKNKPLPPEPGQDAVRPLNYSVHPFSRTNSMKARRRTPAPLCVSRQSTISIPISRVSLRSKYTPAKADSRNDVSNKNSPSNQRPSLFLLPSSPTLSQAEMELEAHLCSINEDAPLETQVAPGVHDPLQISRGPMHMEPSRKPPPPPRSQSSRDRLLGSPKKLHKKISTHVAMQLRPGRETDHKMRKRISAPVPGLPNKAHRVLGRSCTTCAENEPCADSPWDSSDSPQSSTNVSTKSSETPQSDASPIVPDAAFEEVRQRLELLSPKNDTSKVFFGFHERNLAEASPVPPLIEKHSDDGLLSSGADPSKTSNGMIEDSEESLPAELSANRCSRSPPIRITPAPEENDAPILESRACQDELSIRSLGSIAVSEIPDIYASLPSSKSSIRHSLTEEEVERIISADAAERVLLCILKNLDNLEDLFATARVSRGFYRTFKRHELGLMKNALYGMSPAAWELREMSPPFPGLEGPDNAYPRLGYIPTVYLQHYMRDMYTMIALKSMILVHCECFLRADTITALAGGETERASQIDDAFWRVWTFCRIFGCGTNREDNIVAQIDWLKGGAQTRQQRQNKAFPAIGTDSATDKDDLNVSPSFGLGNRGGLSAEDLYDMAEIWTCLGVLVRGFQGKREFARDYGVFDNLNIAAGDVEQEDAALEEWTYHLLTLAPPTVLDVTSPTSPTATTFAHARSRGYTTWSIPSLGASRATFLREALSRVYHEKMLQRHPLADASTTTELECSASKPLVGHMLTSRQRMAAHAAEIRAKRSDPAFKALHPSEERPMSHFPDVLSKLENSPILQDNSPTTAAYASFTQSSYLLPTHLPSHTNFLTPTPIEPPSGDSYSYEEQFVMSTNTVIFPQVRDPVDVAVERLVKMGFDEKKAKKALADTDSGNSIDFDKAVEILVRERKRDVSNLMNWNYRGAVGPEGTKGGQPTVLADPHAAFGLGIKGAETHA